MASLPTVGGSEDTWGDELNEFLGVAHNADGTTLGGSRYIGPVSLDFADLANDGDAITVYTPAAGEYVVDFAVTWSNYTPWDHGPYLMIGQNLNPGDLKPGGDANDDNFWLYQDVTDALVPEFSLRFSSPFETGGISQGSQIGNYFAPIAGIPISVQLVNNDGVPASQGHLDLIVAVVAPAAP